MEQSKLGSLNDAAKRAEWVYGQPMAPCPKCGGYNMKPQLVGKWARATLAYALDPYKREGTLL